MPPKPKITRQMILDAALEITRKEGFEAVNARSIAQKLRCSTRPIFTCYQGIPALKEEFLEFAFGYYERYVEHYARNQKIAPGLLFPLSYLSFAKEETNLFRLLFVSDMALEMKGKDDFYTELGNIEKANAFSRQFGLRPEQGRAVFLDLFFYSHGMAVLTASGKLALNQHNCEELLQRLLNAELESMAGEEAVRDAAQSVSE